MLSGLGNPKSEFLNLAVTRSIVISVAVWASAVWAASVDSSEVFLGLSVLVSLPADSSGVSDGDSSGECEKCEFHCLKWFV